MRNEKMHIRHLIYQNRCLALNALEFMQLMKKHLQTPMQTYTKSSTYKRCCTFGSLATLTFFTQVDYILVIFPTNLKQLIVNITISM